MPIKSKKELELDPGLQDLIEAEKNLKPTGDTLVDSRRRLEVLLEQRRLKQALHADDWDHLIDD